MPPEDLFDGIDQPAGAQDAKPQAGDSSKPADQGAKAVSPPADDKGDSSPPAADKRPASSFEALMQLTQKAKPEPKEGVDDEPEGDSPAPEGKDATAEGDKPAAEAEQPEDQEKKYEPIKNPRRPSEIRINELLTERKDLLPKAQTFDMIRQWNAEMGQSEQQFVRGMELMALANPTSPKYDPKKALEQLDPILKQLRQEAGVVDQLPDDLQQDVSDGRISEERARELARLRLEKASTERRLDQTREQREQERERAVVDSVHKAFSSFDAQQAASDPDWNDKRSDVQDKLKAIWLDEGLPTTPKAAHDQAKRAVEAVNARFKRLRPPKEQIDPKIPNGGSNPRNVVARPKSSIEALNAALAGQRIQY